VERGKERGKQAFNLQSRNGTNGRNVTINYQARKTAGEHRERSEKYKAAEQAHFGEV